MHRARRILTQGLRSNKFPPALRRGFSNSPLANAPPPVFLAAPGTPSSLPSPSHKARGRSAERRILSYPRLAAWAPLAKGARLSALHRGVFLPAPGRASRGRSRLPSALPRQFGSSPCRASEPPKAATGPRQPAPGGGPLVPPGGAPTPPECRVTSPARRRRTADAGLTRYRPNQGGSIIETSRDDALSRARRCGI